MSPGGSGDDQSHSLDVAWLRRSDPPSSASSGRLRCPGSPRCADSSPDRLGEEEDMVTCVVKLQIILLFEGFQSHII